MPGSVSSDDGGSEDTFIVDIDSIQAHGIGAVDISKLRSNGYYTVASVHSALRKNLEKIKGFSEVKVDKIKEAVKKCMPTTSSFMNAHEYLQVRKKVIRVSTGSKNLDKMLGGGFQSQSISEVFGEYRCGKTQICHTMCVIAQLPKEQGGAEGKAIYLDTEGSFRPERIRDIAARFGLDPGITLQNILYTLVPNSEKQQEILDELGEHLMSGDYRLLIVDSIMAHFRADYNGRGELSERQRALLHHLKKLMSIAVEFNICVFMTNQVQSDPGASALFASADGRKPIGGHVLAHASTVRVLLRKGRAEERVAKLVDSPDMPEGEATYIITAGGINDPDKA